MIDALNSLLCSFQDWKSKEVAQLNKVSMVQKWNVTLDWISDLVCFYGQISA